MNLTYNNIQRVIEYTYKGYSYGWRAVLKSGRPADARQFINYKDNRTTDGIEFPKDRLPKSVQKFIETHPRKVRETFEDGHISYIYRA